MLPAVNKESKSNGPEKNLYQSSRNYNGWEKVI